MDHQVQGRALLWRVLGAAIGLFVVVALGAGGYVLLGWDALDAVYQSIITISTVGFREVRDLGAGGKVFTLLLIVIGVGAFTYLLTTVNNYLIADHLYGMLGRRAMQRKIDALEQHVIVCGYGRMGAEVAHEFAREKCPVVVIDRAAAATQSAIAAGHLALTGDAEADGVLKSAGVERARALIAVVDDDASNLMITISARAFSEKLLIVARANREQTERKLIAAGANRVLWPYGVSGRRMAHMAVRPNVVEFLDVVMH
ncbi:MAG: potassium channel protein, partial [Planctomycetota bacterium]